MATVEGATRKDPRVNDYKVRLSQVNSYVRQSTQDSSADNVTSKFGRGNSSSVVFDVTPELTENRTVEYKTMDPIHMPGQIFTYGSTKSRTFSLSNIKLISRTIAEATRNMQILWTLRGWTMPYFGEGSSTLEGEQGQRRRKIRNGTLSEEQRNDKRKEKLQELGRELLGRPPEVLHLSAYSQESALMTVDGRQVRRFPTHLNRVPVVITSLNIPYPADVDYIPDEHGNPMPRVMMIGIELQETRSPRELTNQFSIHDFREGRLVGY